MTTRLLLVAPGLCFIVLAAHFYRAGAWPLVAACGLCLLLLGWPRAWAARAVQLALWAGALEWLWTTFVLVQQRMALAQPWMRLALILGAVTVLTAASSLVFRHPRLRARFRLG